MGNKPACQPILGTNYSERNLSLIAKEGILQVCEKVPGLEISDEGQWLSDPPFRRYLGIWKNKPVLVDVFVTNLGDLVQNTTGLADKAIGNTPAGVDTLSMEYAQYAAKTQVGPAVLNELETLPICANGKMLTQKAKALVLRRPQWSMDDLECMYRDGLITKAQVDALFDNFMTKMENFIAYAKKESQTNDNPDGTPLIPQELNNNIMLEYLPETKSARLVLTRWYNNLDAVNNESRQAYLDQIAKLRAKFK